MPNEENLVPLNKRTKKEQRKIAQQGGIASGEARRRKKTMREAAQLLLSLPPTDGVKKKLQGFDIDQEDLNNQTVLLAAMLREAFNGDVKAAAFVRDTAGENPDKGDSRDVPKENNLLEVIDESLKGLDDDI